MGADADPTDADVAALEAELERFKADATRQLDEIAALTDAADACIADAKRETHEVRACCSRPAACVRRVAGRARAARAQRPPGEAPRAPGLQRTRGAQAVNATPPLGYRFRAPRARSHTRALRTRADAWTPAWHAPRTRSSRAT
jgi:hypothetical protein